MVECKEVWCKQNKQKDKEAKKNKYQFLKRTFLFYPFWSSIFDRMYCCSLLRKGQNITQAIQNKK